MRVSPTVIKLVVVFAVLAASSPVASEAASVSPSGPQSSVDLIAGNAGISVDPNGELGLEAVKDCVGLNPDSRYVFGDPGDPTNESAFIITVQTPDSRTLTVEYRYDDCANAALRFILYDAVGREVGRIDGSSPSVTLSAEPPRSRYYVVMIVDTNGLNEGEALQGTLQVNV